MTAERILEAARAEYGDHGVGGATVRGIAARASVDPSLVLQHFGSKAALFAQAIEPVGDVELSTTADHLSTVVEQRMTALPKSTRALMRSILTSPHAAAVMRDHLEDRAGRLAGSLSEDRSVEAAVVVAAVLGLTIGHHFLDLPALRHLDERDLARITTALLRVLD